MTLIQIFSATVILTTLLKTIYDVWISGSLYKKDKAKGITTIDAAIAKKDRDKIATFLVLGVVTAASILSLEDSVMSENVSREEFNSIVTRVQKLENPLDPTGGGPGGTPAQLADILDDLYERLNSVQTNFVTRDEFDKIVEIVAELKDKTPDENDESILEIQLEPSKGKEASG
jgi:hypothetical protein